MLKTIQISCANAVENALKTSESAHILCTDYPIESTYQTPRSQIVHTLFQNHTQRYPQVRSTFLPQLRQYFSTLSTWPITTTNKLYKERILTCSCK